MKYPNFLILLAIITLTFSCTKDIIPGEEDYKKHPILWTYGVPSDPNSEFYFPVLDEEDNVYILLENSDESSGGDESDSSFIKIISYDKEGNKRWERKLLGEVNSELYYSNERIILLTKPWYLDEDRTNKLYFLNAESSEILNVQNIYSYSYGIDVSESHVYLLHSSAVKTIIRITAFDFDGNEVWEKQDVEGKQIMVVGNAIYASDIMLTKYIDQGDGCASAWEWAPPEENPIDIIDIDNKGNIYLNSYNKTSILTADGQLIKQISGIEYGGYNHFVKITDEGEYIIGDENGLYKYDQELNKLWHIENSESNVRPYFKENNISIAQNGNIYSGSTFGLYVYRPDGVLDWHVGLYQNILELHRPLITSEGNLICLSPERRSILCIKGDGSPPK